MRLILVLVIFGLNACSISSMRPTGILAPQPLNYEDSYWEIGYVRGTNSYRMSAAGNSGPKLRSFVDQSLIREKMLQMSAYIDFFKRLNDFVAKEKFSDGDKPNCRMPFEIKLQFAGQSKMVSGCRRDEIGIKISHFINEAERILINQ